MSSCAAPHWHALPQPPDDGKGGVHDVVDPHASKYYPKVIGSHQTLTLWWCWKTSRRGNAGSISVASPPLICMACWNAWTGPINRGAVLCFGCKRGEGGCHIFWFAWYENSGGLQSMEPVVYLGWNEIFYWDVCISMQFAGFIVADPGASALDFTVNLSWGQYKSRKWIWLFIYMQANRRTLLDAPDDCWNGDPSWLYVLQPGVKAAYQND